jgi:hypothetical protein
MEPPLAGKFRVGFKHQLVFTRILEFLRCVFYIGIILRQCHIYIPRSATKDNFIVYLLFRRRCILISDGITDFISILPVFSTVWKDLSFRESVDPRFHLKTRSFRHRSIFFDPRGPIAVYNKRGRDPDYISDYASMYHSATVLNPLVGHFSQIIAAPSTVLFELPHEMKKHVIIVSQSHCLSLDKSRRRLLAAYESALSALDYRIV